MALIDNYRPSELREIVSKSRSYSEVLKRLGYRTCNGDNCKILKKRLKKLKISTEHFKRSEPRTFTFDDVFCKNSEVGQATLRRYFLKYGTIEYECDICGQKPFWNGKEMMLILDHKNGDNHDNRLCNLRWTCPNCGIQLPTFAGRKAKNKTDPSGKKTAKQIDREHKKLCPKCNKNLISVDSHMCRECYLKEHSGGVPPKEELEEMIFTMSFVKIGEKYGVSDNAVRKWCMKYNIPYRKKDIRRIIAKRNKEQENLDE